MSWESPISEGFRELNLSSGGFSHWDVGSNPGHDTFVLEQYALL